MGYAHEGEDDGVRQEERELSVQAIERLRRLEEEPEEPKNVFDESV